MLLSNAAQLKAYITKYLAIIVISRTDRPFLLHEAGIFNITTIFLQKTILSKIKCVNAMP